MTNNIENERARNLANDIQFGQEVQEINVSPKFTQFIHPGRILISGPTHCGKSYFCLNLVKYVDRLFDTKFERIIYCTPVSYLKQDYLNQLREANKNIETFDLLNRQD